MHVTPDLAKALLRARGMEITPETTHELAKRLQDRHDQVAHQTFDWNGTGDMAETIAKIEQQHMSLREIEMAEWSAEIEKNLPGQAWNFWKEWVQIYPEAIPTLTVMMTMWEVFFPPNIAITAQTQDIDQLTAMTWIEEGEHGPWMSCPMDFAETLSVTDDWDEITPDRPEMLESMITELDWALDNMAVMCVKERLKFLAGWSKATPDLMFDTKPAHYDHPMVELVFSVVPKKRLLEIFDFELDDVLSELYEPMPDWIPQLIVENQADLPDSTPLATLYNMGLSDDNAEWWRKWLAFENDHNDLAFNQWDPKLEMALAGYQAEAVEEPNDEAVLQMLQRLENLKHRVANKDA